MFNVDQSLVESIKASGLFDAEWYEMTYADVKILNIDPVEHYLWIGGRLGRDPSPSFSTAGYLLANPDVAESKNDPFVHYVFTGRFENRSVPEKTTHSLKYTVESKTERTFFEPPANTAARIIAFHLPQFHAFPENNSWWGEGFTEWTNVKPAKSQFLGHYQPHEPHSDIGYYDLTADSVFAKQAELAKTHGIHGFCFYYYWFGGKRLMERAIDKLLDDKSVDLPFCLCWANENWTRRWDGLESEVLIAQDHSEEDDLACIKDLARYIADERYIKVNGRPLLLVYRPSLLPDPAATAERWRQWCRDNGIGEVYLAYTQSFETEDPRKYGFDAAIEFPPNNSGPTDLTNAITPYAPDYAGKVYNWADLADRSQQYSQLPYKLYRSVCPGWDNTARRKDRGSVLINNTPEKYEAWLKNAVRETVVRADDDSERLVFVNAWNEWAEGAHLEPDRRNGYAYLDATRRAVSQTAARPKVAVAIHAFYPEVLPEILAYLNALPGCIDLFVTTSIDKANEIRVHLQSQSRPFEIIICENKGRDVLPFLGVLDVLVKRKYDYAAKVHTKKSLHRDDGNKWRQELYEAVIGTDAFYRSLVALENDPSLGMLGPEGHLVSMNTYLGSNLDRVSHFARKLGIAHDKLLDYAFFAGTMFIGRVAALAPLLNLGVAGSDFETEAGQIDGTLAHALERVIGLCVSTQQYRLAYSMKPFDEVEINRRYGFA